MPPNPVDPHLGKLWRNSARVIRDERRLNATVRRALNRLFKISTAALATGNYDAAVLDSRMPEWRSIVAADVLPMIGDVFTGAFNAAARGKIDPNVYAIRYIESRTNQLVGVADEVFDSIRLELAAGREAHESISELAKRVDGLLLGAGADRWKNRAVTIARTETIGANNTGAHGSARATASVLGVNESLIVKEWLATGDGRTRETHAGLDRQFVIGMDTPFDNGLLYAGDDAGPAEETINCRCTTLYHYPGDPDYPGRPDLFASGAREDTTMTQQQLATDSPEVEGNDGIVIVALPAADDPVHGIGPEDKHATLLWFGHTSDHADPAAVAAGIRESVELLISTDQPEPFDQDTTSVERLGDDDPQALVVKLVTGDSSLETLRSALLSYDAVIEPYESVKQWPKFTPHVTLGYPESDSDELAWTEAADALDSIRFDRLAVWIGDDRTEYPLTSSDTTEEDTMPDDALAAAAGDPVPAVRPQTNDAGDAVPAISLDTPEDDAAEDRFHGVCMVENVQTGDGRAFAPGSVEWDGLLPLPVGWQVEDAPGHDGSVICGRIDTMERVGNLIRYEGTWDTDGIGWETRRLVGGQFLRGISVDIDDVDGVMIDAEGNELDPMEVWGDEEGLLWVTTRGRIRSAALCRVPAFAPVDNPESVFVANGTWADAETAPEPAEDEPVEPPADDEVVAALVAAATTLDLPAAPPLPPLSDFTDPQLDGPTPVTVTPDGRVFGHVASWGTCHIGVEGRCVTPPRSATGYAHFLKGETETDQGLIATGVLTMSTGHAAPSLGALPAAAHYDNTGTIWARVGAGDDTHGIWIAGRVAPNTTPEQIDTIRAAGALSGDWRRIGGNLELVAALAVNVPGFPIPRVSMAASGAVQTALVASGVVVPLARDLTADELAETIAERVMARIKRDDRLTAAAARVEQSAAQQRQRRIAAAAARIGG